MKDIRLHMIGHAHIDPVWLWQWQEGFHEVKATFRSALDRMEEYPDFIFVASSAAFYEWVEQSDPQMFAEIQQRVAEGRWHLIGGWWIEPDCNIPCGESFVRQGLYGQRYFQEKFGRTAEVGFNADSFGHHGMLPQILKKSGLSYYVFLRPSPHEKGLPGRLFWWESDDCSRVLAFRIPYEYLSDSKDIAQHVLRCAREAKAPLTDMMCFYGVGNHGGGPTRANLESIARLQNEVEFPALVFSSPDQFFAEVTRNGHSFPVVHDDLQHHASGCYAAHSAIKRWNRQSENRLLAAEKLSVVAESLTGQPYPTDFDRAWKNVLFNQFHDILAGTSLEAAYEDAWDLYGEARAIAGRGLNNALQSLAWNLHIKPEEGMRPILVANPNAWEYKGLVELETSEIPQSATLLDENDQEIPFQEVRSQVAARGRSRLSFVADLPALGYRLFRLAPRPLPPSQRGPHQLPPSPDDPGPLPPYQGGLGGILPATDTLLENQRFRLEIDPQTGTIASLRDKREQVEVFAGPSARAVVIEDRSDTWSHNIYRYDQEIGEFSPVSVQLVEHGPVKAAIRVVSEYAASRLIQDFTLYCDLERIDVHVTLDWRERLKVLKLRFPVNLNFIKVTHEIPYGHTERFANGDEQPVQSWVDLSGIARDNDRLYGFSLLNDGKYSLDVNHRDIGLTVLRSPIYANHLPVAPDENGTWAFQDQGVQRFTYSLLPHAGSWEEAGTVRRAAELNQPPVPLIATYHPEGTLPQSLAFIKVDRENVLVTALKKAEDGDDLILRAYETSKIATTATIDLPILNRAITAVFGPCEIKTFRIPRSSGCPVVEVDLLENQNL
jgi:alpha-mannosidase